jgi:hypothetical protein
MASVENIALRLLTETLPDSEVAGLLLELADVKQPVKMPTPPSDAAAARILRKGGWAKAASVAASGCSGDIAARLAANPSLQVRRLICTTSVDQEVLREMHAWASTKREKEAMNALLLRIDPDWLLDTVEQGTTQYQPEQYTRIAARAATSLPDGYDRLVALDVTRTQIDVVAATAHLVAEGKVPGWDLARVVAAVGDRAPRVLTAVAGSFSGTVDVDTLDVYAADEDNWLSLRSTKFDRATGFTAAAATRLVTDHPSWGEEVAKRNAPDEVVDQLIDLHDYRTSMELLRRSPERLTREQLHRLLCTVDPETIPPQTNSYHSTLRTPDELLLEIAFDLDSDALLAYLRLGALDTTWQWLNGKSRQKPRPGEIAALFEEYGYAFGASVRYANNGYSRTAMERPDVARLVVDRIDFEAAEPWLDELVDALGPDAIEAMLRSYSPGPSAYLAARLSRELGSDPAAWRDALVQLSRSKMSLGRTIDAVKKLRAPRLRKTDEVSDVTATPPQVQAGEIGRQLCLEFVHI